MLTLKLTLKAIHVQRSPLSAPPPLVLFLFAVFDLNSSSLFCFVRLLVVYTILYEVSPLAGVGTGRWDSFLGI